MQQVQMQWQTLLQLRRCLQRRAGAARKHASKRAVVRAQLRSSSWICTRTWGVYAMLPVQLQLQLPVCMQLQRRLAGCACLLCCFAWRFAFVCLLARLATCCTGAVAQLHRVDKTHHMHALLCGRAIAAAAVAAPAIAAPTAAASCICCCGCNVIHSAACKLICCNV